LETPVVTDDAVHDLILTFGDVGTTARTASAAQMSIMAATANVFLNDADGTNVAVVAAVHSISGNQLKIAIGEKTVNGADVPIVNTDKVVINVIAFAKPVHA
jgi:hypothetical protein